MDCFLNAQLDRHYAELDQLDAAQEYCNSLISWFVKTPEWEEYASTKEELGELMAIAIKDGVQPEISEIPF